MFRSFLFLAFSFAGVSAFAQTPISTDAALFRQGATILFQGDSITDGNRGRSEDPNHIHGHGYVYLIASYLGANFPENGLTFINRGVSGDTVERLAQRWQTDTLDLRPDVLSIMIGANDLWSKHAPDEFETGYDSLLAKTIEALPNVKLILVEPFWSDERGSAEAEQFRNVVRKMAERYHAVFVPLQSEFDTLLDQGPEHYWIWDKVHPTTAGHWVIFRQWMNAVRAADE